MKFKHSFTVVWIIALTLFSAQASQPEDQTGSDQNQDTGIIMERPELPRGAQIGDLPNSTSYGRKSVNCYNAYLIQKYGFRSGRHGIGFAVRLTNMGDCPLYQTRLTDFFPDNTRLDRAFPRPDDFDHDRASWKIGYLGVGYTAHIDLDFDIKHRNRDRDDDRERDHDRDRGRDRDRFINTACAWNSVIGQKICAWASVHRDHD